MPRKRGRRRGDVPKSRNWQLFAAGVLGGLILAWSPPALAQDEAVTGGLEKTSATSAKDKEAFVSSALTEIKGIAKGISKALEDAERESDMVRSNCLTKKQASVATLVEVAEQAQAQMNGYLAGGDSEKADFEFRKVAVALSKARQFSAEADACLGESGTQPGVTDVQVTVEGLADGDDLAPIDDGNDDIGVDPPETSPFQ
jgi:hypothetical protein